MAFDVGSVVAHIKADLTDFEGGINRAKAEAEGFGGVMGRVGGVMSTALVVGGAAAAAGVAFLGKSALDAAGDFEQTKIAFETMLGSASKAQKLLAELQQFAKATPFNLTQLQQSTKQLLAYGVESDKVIDTMKTLGNISAAVGMDKLPQLILAFGQVKAAGHLMGTELRQFTETGTPLLQMLADQFHVTTGEIQKMVSDGKIGFTDVQKALEGLGGEHGKWGDLMTRQSKTLQGSLSNLQDSWNQLLVVLGTYFIPIATKVIQTLTAFLGPIMDLLQGHKSLQETFGLTAQQTQMLQGVLNEFQSFLFDTLLPAVAAVITAMGIWWNKNKDTVIATWNVIFGVIQIIWSLIYGLLKVGLELMAGDWEGAWKAMHQMTEGVWAGIQRILNNGLAFIGGWGGMIFDALTKPFRDAWNTISALVNKIKDALDFTKRHSPSVVDIVERGVHLVNNALDDLNMGVTSMHATVAPAVTAPVGGGQSFNNITIDLGGAVISDELGAQRIGERIGDSIIRKLQANVRF